MDIEALTAYCLAKPGAWPDNPWGHELPVIKVGARERGKIFAILRTDGVGLKSASTREEADEWLHRYPDDAAPTPYIGRSGWNDLRTGGAIPDEEILEAVDDSYRLIVTKLPKSARPAGWNA